MTQPSVPQLPVLPRELIDAILSELIILCHDDPAYQWTCLRNITLYHRAQVGQHFFSYWVPGLTLTLTRILPGMHLEVLDGDNKSTESRSRASSDVDNTVKLVEIYTKEPHQWLVRDRMDAEDSPEDFAERLRLSLDKSDWSEEDIWLSEQSDEFTQRTHPVQSPSPELPTAIVTFGEGTLNKGYTKGGIMNHLDMIPGLMVELGVDGLFLDWKQLFSQLFNEEMLMRRFRDRLLENFLPTLGTWMSEEEKNKATHIFLTDHYQLQRRELLSSYRTHFAHNHRASFDMTPFLSLSKPAEEDYSPLDLIFLREESMVFQIPGWEAFDIREVAKLRISEELITEGMTSGTEWGYAGEQYLGDMTEREAEMSGQKDVDEETLKEWLKGDALDPGRFWDW